MSAIYHRSDCENVYNPAFNMVVDYVKANPGADLAAIATATRQPYQVVYAVCVAAGFIILPNAAGELHWHASQP